MIGSARPFADISLIDIQELKDSVSESKKKNVLSVSFSHSLTSQNPTKIR